MSGKPVFPEAFIDRPMPSRGDHEPPAPGVFQLHAGSDQTGDFLVAIRKVSYKIAADGSLNRTSNQTPIFTEYAELPPLSDGRKGSYSEVPEVRFSQAGTDFVVRATARSATPVREMKVGVKIGAFTHRVRVTGNRKSVFKNGRVSFTPPDLFTEMPLRYELAYGGMDNAFVASVCSALRAQMSDSQWQRSAAFFKETLPVTVPCIYARNACGLGYIADVKPELLDGVSLPNLEREDDLLTEARFSTGSGLDWLQRPLVAGFDFFDEYSFPRTAMFGLPPPELNCDWPNAPEVKRGLIPRDFSRGNIVTADPAEQASLIHPEAGRCAAPGLQLPFLLGDERVRLIGMSSDMPFQEVLLPGERPQFLLPGESAVNTKLFQVFIDVEQQVCSLLWVGRWNADRHRSVEELAALQATVRTQVQPTEKRS
jgi:hypothetical protein